MIKCPVSHTKKECQLSDGSNEKVTETPNSNQLIPELKDLTHQGQYFWSESRPEFYMCEKEDQWFLNGLQSPKQNYQQRPQIDKKLFDPILIGGESLRSQNRESQLMSVLEVSEQIDIKGKKERNLKSKIERNEAKNIPKNVSKQVIKLVKCNRPLIECMLVKIRSPLTFTQFNAELQKIKLKNTRIGDLRSLWSEFDFSREVRVIFEFFLRKQLHHWVYNSRIKMRQGPLKYRHALQEGLKDPSDFNHLKSM